MAEGMQTRYLGRSGLKVSRLCFGTLTVSPSQAALPPEEAGELLAYAYSNGVTFWDTAEYYDNYPHIRAALRRVAGQPVIATKTYAFDRQTAAASLDHARRSLDLDVIDIVLLHEQETCLTMDGHREAFAFLLEQKSKGVIRAAGLSTHAVEPVRALADAGAETPPSWRGIRPGPYKYADVVHPILNMRGIGILDGGAADMVLACERAHEAGLGIYGMKMLGGGHLLKDFEAAAAFALDLACVDAFAVGMQTVDEVDMNIALFKGDKIDPDKLAKTCGRSRHLMIGDWCSGCGACAARCGENALRIVNGKAAADETRCVFCGYCAQACRDFAIKVV